MKFSELAKKRRTHYDFSGEPITREEILPLLEIAIQAPNHRRNQPWRFLILEQNGIAQYWKHAESFFDRALAGKPEDIVTRKRKKLAERLPKLGAMVVVTSVCDPISLVTEENYAASCCAVQNLLLAAAENGWGSFWSTGAVFSSEPSRELLGLGSVDEVRFVGAIWLGHPVSSPMPPEYDLMSRVRVWPEA